MKSIRNTVFETNSSSTHSMTIRRIPENEVKIPFGVEKYDICQVKELGYNKVVVGEVQKLRYLIAFVASRIIEDVDDGVLELSEEYYSYWGNKADLGWEKFKKNILQHFWVIWISEVVKEERNTSLVFDKVCDEFPYISEVYSFEDSFSYEMLDISRKDMNDEKRVKEVFRDIIFNPNIVIEDRVENR
jgi:hypothetical protein